MGAIFGVLGDASASDLAAIGDRLAHHGSASAIWFPAQGLDLGVRGPPRSVQAQQEGSLVFDGAIDNRCELGQPRGGPRPDDLGPDQDAALLAELVGTLGTESVARLAGQVTAAVWVPSARRLLLMRDRIGCALLYFTLDQGFTGRWGPRP